MAKITPVQTESKPVHQIKNIAIYKVVGDLDTAIGNDLIMRGYTITYLGDKPKPVHANETKDMSIKQPSNLDKLLDKNIDAVLIVKSDHAGIDTNLRAAEIRMYSTRQNAIIAGASWVNAQGGFQSSEVDRFVRQGSVSAARDINNLLLEQLQLEVSLEERTLLPSATSLTIKTLNKTVENSNNKSVLSY